LNILNNLADDIEHTGSEIMFGNDMPIVNGNPIRFTRVLQNLIGNGLKYQPKGSKSYIQIKAKDKTDLWEFSVEDNGIGINEKYYNKIFLPFQRLHNQREYKGTGIGLTISKKIVESWGGDLWCDSTLGKGTVFYFTIKK
jgi:light-regulated signal transduction histidine kinase (bacteriophytochrome)